MTYTYTPYVWPFAATIVLNLVMIFYLLKNRRMNGAPAFSVTLLFSSLWSLGTLMEIGAVEMAAKLFWTKVAYPAYAFSPVAWFVMIMRMTDQWHGVKWKSILFICVVPVITAIFAWTNDFHSFIWHDVLTDPQQVPYSIILKHGRWFWVHVVYSDGLNLLSVFFTFRFWRSKAPLYGRQFRCLVFSMLFVMLVNAAYVLKIIMIDMTSVAWGISSLFILWALFRNKLFDLVPIARNRVMESMADSIVVLDLKNRIVAMNPAAQAVFQCQEIQGIGKNAADFWGLWLPLAAFIQEGGKQAEFKHRQNQAYQYYDVMCLPVKNERENVLGKLIVMRDITEKKRTEHELLQKQQEMAVKEERERMAGEQ